MIGSLVLLLASVSGGGPPGGGLPTLAPPSQERPAQLENVGVEPRIGDSLPLDLELVDETGQAVRLGDLFGDRPVILAPVYYECPMLCQIVLEGLASSLKMIQFTEARDYELVAVSFDHDEGPEQARDKKLETAARMGRDVDTGAWHFLTGDEESVRRFTDSIGFSFEYDEEIDQFIHPATLVVATPNGVISRYLYGVDYPPKDLRLALIEASQEQLGGIVDQVLLYCYRYDPTTGKYSLLTMRLVRGGAALTVVALGLFITLMLRWERRHRRSTTEATS